MKGENSTPNIQRRTSKGGAPTRPLARYHGGKWRLAPWIIAQFPPHRIYVEPFGGAASVLLRKPRSYAEIYNDLDGEIVNLFRVARDHGEELVRRLELTPFSRAEFLESYKLSSDPVEQARRTLVRSYQGFGSAAVCGELSGFRANSNRSGTTPAHDWRNYPEAFRAIIERLRGVVIEHRDAGDVMACHDSPETLHYVDPPYVHATRSEKTRGTVTRKAYRHEMDDDAHRNLAVALNRLSGMVVLSGYISPLYEQLFRDWRRVERLARVDGGAARTEVLWLRNCPEETMELFRRDRADGEHPTLNAELSTPNVEGGATDHGPRTTDEKDEDEEEDEERPPATGNPPPAPIPQNLAADAP